MQLRRRVRTVATAQQHHTQLPTGWPKVFTQTRPQVSAVWRRRQRLLYSTTTGATDGDHGQSFRWRPRRSDGTTAVAAARNPIHEHHFLVSRGARVEGKTKILYTHAHTQKKTYNRAHTHTRARTKRSRKRTDSFTHTRARAPHTHTHTHTHENRHTDSKSRPTGFDERL